MWRSISLRTRLNIIFASLFALWLAVDAAHVAVEASGRARAETQSAMRLTKDLAISAIARLEDAPDPERAVESLIGSLQNLRHVRVGLGEPSLASATALAASEGSEAPAWFRALVNAPIQVAAIPLVFKDHRTESIIIVADPSDEIDEAWVGARDHAVLGALMALAALGATSLLVGRAVKPLGIAGATLARLEAGDYSARAEGGGPPEVRKLNEKINSLAETLGGLNRANAELMDRVFDAHDEERHVIAHELHDEFGPHLFALRASAALLSKKIGDDDSAARVTANAIEAQIEALQGQNRRILADLRPAALEELGLAEALSALIAHWRRAEPEVAVQLHIDPRAEAMGERASLMAYRFVQEAMTNAYRHAGATHIDVSLRFEDQSHDANLRDPALAGLVIRVADDGRGLQGQSVAGMGLAGMRDRVRILGGQVVIGSSPAGGVVAEASFGTAAASGDQESLPTDSGISPRKSSNH
jgi:two-component system, NarL family, sensor histidine kinase UhpB